MILFITILWKTNDNNSNKKFLRKESEIYDCTFRSDIRSEMGLSQYRNHKKVKQSPCLMIGFCLFGLNTVNAMSIFTNPMISSITHTLQLVFLFYLQRHCLQLHAALECCSWNLNAHNATVKWIPNGHLFVHSLHAYTNTRIANGWSIEFIIKFIL